MLSTKNRFLCEMICRNPEAYSAAAVQRAACWMLGYLNLSQQEVAEYAMLCTWESDQ